MCEPVSISLAVAAVAAGVAQQQQSANVENKYQEIAYGQRKARAFETFAALNERDLQERAKAAADIQNITNQARAAAATAKLAALEGGVGGRSVNALLDQFQRNELVSVGAVQSGLTNTQAQLQREARSAGMLQGPAHTFGPLDTPLGIAATGLNLASAGFNAYQAAKSPTPAA